MACYVEFNAFGTRSRARTDDPLLVREVLSQLSYSGISTSAEHLIGTLSPCETSIVYLPAEFEPLTVAELFTKQDGVVLITRDTISLIRNISWLRTEESNPQLVLLMQKKYRLLYRLNWCRIRDSNP